MPKIRRMDKYSVFSRMWSHWHSHTLLVVWWFSNEVVSNSCNPMDWSPPGSSVHGIFQARRLEWAAISAHLPDPGIKTRSTALQAISCIASDSLPLGHQGSPIH